MSPREATPLVASEVEAGLEEILKAPPFDDSPFTDLLTRLVDWYRDLGNLHASDPILFWGALIGLSTLLGFLLWHLSVSLRSVWRAIRRVREPVPIPAREKRRFDLEPARAALVQGDFRRAIEVAWGAAVAAWDVDTVLAETPRGQARALLQRLPTLHAATLRELLALHERACYADELMGAPEAESALHHAEVIGGAAA